MARVRPIAVVVFAALVVACFVTFGVTVEALVNSLGCAVLVAVTVTDLERRIMPNRIIVPAIVVALVVQTVRDPSIEWIVAALAAGGFFLIAALIYPAGLGMGDVKLGAFLGAWLGTPVIVAFFVGSLLALIPAIVILAMHGKAGRKMGIPFAPFLAGAAWWHSSSVTRSWTPGLGRADLVLVVALVLVAAGCGGGRDEQTVTVACNDAAFRAQDEELYVTKTAISNAIGGAGEPAALLLDLRRARKALATYLDAHPPCADDLAAVAAHRAEGDRVPRRGNRRTLRRQRRGETAG